MQTIPHCILTENTSDHILEINLEINNELNKVMNWLKVNKLSLNVQKTKYMTFRKSQKNVTPLNLSKLMTYL